MTGGHKDAGAPPEAASDGSGTNGHERTSDPTSNRPASGVAASLYRSLAFRQSLALYGAYLAVVLLSIASGSINARFLEPEGYGVYAFVLSVLSFVGIFFSFGFFRASQRVIAIAGDREQERELVAAVLVVTLGIGLLFCACIAGLSVFIDRIFSTQVGPLLRVFSLACVVLPFAEMLPKICVGANRIYARAVDHVLPKILYVLAALCLVSASLFSVRSALAIYFGTILLTVVTIALVLRPVFRHLGRSLKLIYRETKSYGFHVYLGGIADLSTYELDKLFITYFVNTTMMGFYRLAAFLCAPMRMLSTAISESSFKTFTRSERIPNTLLWVNLAWLLSCLVGLVVLGRTVVRVLFSVRYDPVVPLILPLALATFFAGLYQPYHFFLAARGRGRELKRVSVVQAIFNTIGNFIFIMKYGAMGAAWVSAVAKGLEFSLNFYYYRIEIRKADTASPGSQPRPKSSEQSQKTARDGS